MATWRELIQDRQKDINDENPLVSVLGDIDVEFDDGYGGTCGPDFVAFTKRFVYFPICYDGAEWAGSAPRSPRGAKPQSHQGGG